MMVRKWTSQLRLQTLRWSPLIRGRVDVELFSVSRCRGSAEMPPWWRWLRGKEFYVERLKLVSGPRRICVNRTVCPSCPAGRGSSRRRIRPRPLPVAPDRPPRCSGTPPSEINCNSTQTDTEHNRRCSEQQRNKEEDDAAVGPRPPHWHLPHVVSWLVFSGCLIDSICWPFTAVSQL